MTRGGLALSPNVKLNITLGFAVAILGLLLKVGWEASRWAVEDAVWRAGIVNRLERLEADKCLCRRVYRTLPGEEPER